VSSCTSAGSRWRGCKIGPDAFARRAAAIAEPGRSTVALARPRVGHGDCVSAVAKSKPESTCKAADQTEDKAERAANRNENKTEKAAHQTKEADKSEDLSEKAADRTENQTEKALTKSCGKIK
jgi:hypothetical protein